MTSTVIASGWANGTVETLAYDPAGQLIERQRGGEQWSWTYNTRGLITHSASSTDAGDEARHTNFDADGQPVDGTSYWTNGWVVPTSFDHDPDGRLVEARLASTPVFAADYDPRGLATEITAHWDGEARTTERVYDGGRYLVTLDPGDGTQPIAWDRSRAAGPVLATQQMGDRDGLVSYLQGPTGAVGVHYGPVWLGGVNRDPNASNLNHYFLEGYDPWGNPEGTVAPARFGLGYRGELTIDGVIHLRNRDYHPGLHTFTSPDPLHGVPGTPTVANRYHYANNGPHTQVDPLGLRPDDNAPEWQPRQRESRAEEMCGASRTLIETQFDSHSVFEAAVRNAVAAGEAVHLRVRDGWDPRRGLTYTDHCGDEFVAARDASAREREQRAREVLQGIEEHNAALRERLHVDKSFGSFVWDLSGGPVWKVATDLLACEYQEASRTLGFGDVGRAVADAIKGDPGRANQRMLRVLGVAAAGEGVSAIRGAARVVPPVAAGSTVYDAGCEFVAAPW
ncbi:MAG: RHS repeat-associated core domain-containing protein [Acidimicrobiales bacterium]